MTEFTQRFKSALAGALLLILSAYYVNSSMFYHEHTVYGETIFHSHFHTSEHTEPGDGGHTVDVIKLIAALSDFALEQQRFETPVDEPTMPLESITAVGDTNAAMFYVERCRSLRAPPCALS
ncbi:MAG: hypothetical protein SNF93_05725 [Rikenellaceae bacterium]